MMFVDFKTGCKDWRDNIGIEATKIPVLALMDPPVGRMSNSDSFVNTFTMVVCEVFFLLQLKFGVQKATKTF